MKNQWRSFITGFVTAALIFCLGAPALAATTRQLNAVFNDIKITIDGVEFVAKDFDGNKLEPFTVDGVTYLPVRAISEALGLKVDWDQAAQTVKLTRPEATQPSSPITLGIGQYTVGVDIPAGKYDCKAVSGFGNFQGDVASLRLGSLNEILYAEDEKSSPDDPSVYRNLILTDGDVIEIKFRLTVEFTKK